MRRCKSCKARIVFLLSKKKNRLIPTDIDTVSETELEDLKNKKIVYFNKQVHRTHFDTCPDAAKFRKKKNKSSGDQLTFFDAS